MIKNKTIQFRYKKDIIIKLLPSFVKERIKSIIKDGKFYASIYINNHDPDYDNVNELNIFCNNKSIIRLIQETIELEYMDIIDNNYYELYICSDREEIKLIKDPISYYNINIECESCGRYLWIQKNDLSINKEISYSIDETNNGELLVLENFIDDLKLLKCNGIEFRKTNMIATNQLIIKNISEIKNNSYYKEFDICNICQKPRIVKYENSNGVDMFDEANNKAKIETSPILELQKVEGHISLTNVEFGTLGRIPEVLDYKINPYDFSFKTSHKKIIISGIVAKLLFKNKKHNFRILPCKITNNLE